MHPLHKNSRRNITVSSVGRRRNMKTQRILIITIQLIKILHYVELCLTTSSVGFVLVFSDFLLSIIIIINIKQINNNNNNKKKKNENRLWCK